MTTRTRVAQGLAGAAVLVAAVTVVSRVVGFGRWLVFSRTVGTNCLSEAYNTANQLPNIVFEIVAGGALASVTVPLLAGPLARGAREEAEHVVSALLTWALAVLTPLAVLGMLVARPFAALLFDTPADCAEAAFLPTVARMLLVFLPQLPLYGAAVVLSGVLQAGRRFLAPALAPLVSSLVVIVTYVTFAMLHGPGPREPSATPRSGELVLALGTTLGVLVLALTNAVALRGTGLRLRPALRFPPGAGGRAWSLAGAGIATLIAQQLATLTVVLLSNHQGQGTALTVYNYAWALYLLPYAVLAVPIATSAFPAFSAHAEGGDQHAYRATVAATTRAVLLASSLGAGVLAACAHPAARVFLGATANSEAKPAVMATALVAFAPGLLGYGLVALLSRALYAAGHGRAAATTTVAGWATVIIADVVLARLLPPERAVVAFALGNTIGMTLAGVSLVTAVRRTAGPDALAGLPRAALAGVLGGLLAYGAGAWTAGLLATPGWLCNAVVAVLAALVAVGVFILAAVLIDGRDLRALLRRAQ
ncbi:Virulence factor MVIN family protein [Carbonactinospora thermoautotrophica]|uniref:Virulence factor MVIN family protein n=1 Tax=Carbonactinospora thermoautotrophica TaxID=1469144 RepID=A0A132MSF8_9ACTN|nr:lipid II flippase MurJ [Carbonactinospora thermoautotrophica]KWX00818.1 Virulence factor MVIN family protein [Carbonactinospora thermoautotrophica]